MAKEVIRGKFMDSDAYIRKQRKLKSNGPRIIFRMLKRVKKKNSTLQKVEEKN